MLFHRHTEGNVNSSFLLTTQFVNWNAALFHNSLLCYLYACTNSTLPAIRTSSYPAPSFCLSAIIFLFDLDWHCYESNISYYQIDVFPIIFALLYFLVSFLQVAGTIRNCCFEADTQLLSLLSLAEYLWPALLLPVAGKKVLHIINISITEPFININLSARLPASLFSFWGTFHSFVISNLCYTGRDDHSHVDFVS